MKKLFAILLTIAMLLPLCTPIAATETQPPTIEEILNNHHDKMFTSQLNENTNTTSTWARSGSNANQSLAQETISELTAAGYEAYNVSNENYGNLESYLRTDFADMGLNPESSYIMVISGEDEDATSNPNGRGLGNLPVYDMIDPGGGSSYFTYYYNNTPYKMRYVTITSADVNCYNELYRSDMATLSNIQYFDEIAGAIGDYAISYASDKVVEKVVDEVVEEVVELIPYAGIICTVVSLLIDIGEDVSQEPLQIVDAGTWLLSAGTAWTREYIQIYNADTGYWYTVQCSSYANTEATIYGAHVYNPETNAPEQLGGIAQKGTIYSLYYNNASVRQTRAVEGYLGGYMLYDCTGDIDYYFSNPNDSAASQVLVFTHEESSAYLLPSIQED